MPSTIEALVIVALVLAPGYVLAFVASAVIAFVRTERADLAALLPTITCGSFVHAVLSPWTLRVLGYYRDDALTDHSAELVGWGVMLVLVVPVVLGVLAGQVLNVDAIDDQLDKIGLGYVDRMPAAWDFVIQKEESAFVRVYLADGSVVGGAFSSRSFGSSTAGKGDLYLEEAWRLDERNEFVKPLRGTTGVWIAHSAIGRIEFFTTVEAGSDASVEGEEQEDNAGAAAV
jgi:hypothetical protein